MQEQTDMSTPVNIYISELYFAPIKDQMFNKYSFVPNQAAIDHNPLLAKWKSYLSFFTKYSGPLNSD